MTKLPEKTTFPEDAIRWSKQEFPPAQEGTGALSIVTASFAHLSDRIQPWGTGYSARDRQLREFWPTESYLASAIYSVCIRNAAFEWEVQVPGEGTKGTRLETALTDMLNGSQAQQDFGWTPFISAISEDIYTQDNGMFIELIRDPGMDVTSKFKNENAPVVGMAHLDAAACVRTGNPMTPVIYYDRNTVPHLLNWWEVIGRSEFPSAMESMNGIGYCAVTRIQRVAEILYSIGVYKDEKISGRQFGVIHFVSGPSRKELDDTLEKEAEKADNQGYIRWMKPAIVVSLDPESSVSTASIEFASLPDNFDMDAELKWYISALALGLGSDYQDFAPLPSGNLGSGEQSEILHRKSSGKGPAHFMESFQNWMRDYGVIPRIAEFKFKMKDREEELDEVIKHKHQAELLTILRRANIIDSSSAREMVKEWDIIEDQIIDAIPDDFGNDEMMTRQMLGTAGGSTTGEDAQRVEKGMEDDEMNVIQRVVKMYVNRKRKDFATGQIQQAIVKLTEILGKRKEPPINITVPEQPVPQITLEPKIDVQVPKTEVTVEPNITVDAPKTVVKEAKAPEVHVKIEDSGEEIVEVISRDKEGRVKRVKKTRK